MSLSQTTCNISKPSRPLCVHTARQGGAALLVAMLIVTLVASLAAAATWQQWRSAQAQADERARSQAHWLARGALDWGKIVLNIDRRQTVIDDLTEPWAVPLEESRLGTFLEAENNVSQNANEDLAEAFFSGSIQDLQARLNLNSLVFEGKPDPVVQTQFEKLFESLGLTTSLATQMVGNYLASLQSKSNQDIPLTPTCTQQLFWLGLTPEQLRNVESYVTVLPKPTAININTASEIVLRAVLPTNDASIAARIVAQRTNKPFRNIQEVQKMLPENSKKLTERYFSVKTDYFELTGKLRLETLETQDRFVLYRGSEKIITIAKAC